LSAREGTADNKPSQKGKGKMSNIFSSESSENPIHLIKQSLSVKPDDSGEVMVSFVVNKGKGSGTQILPFGQFREAVEILQNAATQGIPEIAEENDLPAAEVIRQTLRSEDGMISFRVKSGKGSKPARMSVEDFAAVAELLASTVDAVEAAGKALSAAAKK
jgi:hypothetical protein